MVFLKEIMVELLGRIRIQFFYWNNHYLDLHFNFNPCCILPKPYYYSPWNFLERLKHTIKKKVYLVRVLLDLQI